MNMTLLLQIKQICRHYIVITILSLSSVVAFSQPACPPLTVFCQDLHTSFMEETCMVEVWAKDFVHKINDAGTSLDDFIITFDEAGTQMSLSYESTYGNAYTIDVWIRSKCDTSLVIRCIVNLDINDNTGNCPQRPCTVDPADWCGYAVVTCSTVQGSTEEFTGNTAALIDTRKNSRAPRGDSWTLPVKPGNDTVDFIRPEAWKINNIGNVYGIAVNPHNGDIFLAASDVYIFDYRFFMTIGLPTASTFGPAGPGGIYKSSFQDPETTNPLVFTRNTYPPSATFNALVIGSNLIPNTGNIENNDDRSGNGIGNIAYDSRSGHLFASNLEDGKLYSINSVTGIIEDVFDPFDPYIHTPGMVKPDERIWGIQIAECGLTSRLYMSRSTRIPSFTPDVIDSKEIWSIAIDANGKFSGTERIEAIIDKGDMAKFTDIAFNYDCREMMLAERGNAHSAEVYRLIRSNDDTWIFDQQFFVGVYDTANIGPRYPQGIRGNSSAGGVSYGPSESGCIVDNRCDDIIWISVNCGDIAADDDVLPPTPHGCRTYGVQGIDREGNLIDSSKFTDIYLGFDTDFTDDNTFLKSNIGEIEIFNCCCPLQEKRDTISGSVPVRIGGSISTESRNHIPQVAVAISSGAMKNEMNATNSGTYQFDVLDKHQNYTVTPSKMDQFLDGISTLDLIQIQRHILGRQTLNSPYKIVAADVNRDMKVSSSDMVTLRQIILGKQNVDGLSPWVFIPSAYQFENPIVPFPYDTDIIVKDLESQKMYENFIGVKLGDVTGDNRFDRSLKSNNARSVTLKLEMNADGVVQVFVTKKMALRGMQLELEFDENISIVDLREGSLAITESHFNVDNNTVKISYNDMMTKVITSDLPLFSLHLSDISNLDQIDLKNDFAAEMYNDKDEIYDLILEKEIYYTDNSFALTNAPNPFKDQTTFTFELNEDKEVSFVFYDVAGRMIYNSTQVYQRGVNSFTLNSDQLQSYQQGIVLYKVVSDHQMASGRIVLLP